jgi:hypothetical protein
LSKYDTQAIDKIHQYFDYNLNFIDRTTSSKPNYVLKVHQPELNLASIEMRMGMTDQALHSVLETIRIA